MTGWIVFGCVLLVLFLISLIRLGGRAEYSADGFYAWVKLGSFYIRVFPPGEKKGGERSKKTREKKKPPEEPSAQEKGGSLARLKELLPLAIDAVGRVLRTIRVDMLYLDFISAGKDPAAAAMSFGYANAAIGMIFPLLEQNLHIKERRIRTQVDFQQEESTVYLLAQLSLTVGQLTVLAVVLAFKFLRYLLTREKKAPAKTGEKNQKEAV